MELLGPQHTNVLNCCMEHTLSGVDCRLPHVQLHNLNNLFNFILRIRAHELSPLFCMVTFSVGWLGGRKCNVKWRKNVKSENIIFFKLQNRSRSVFFS